MKKDAERTPEYAYRLKVVWPIVVVLGCLSATFLADLLLDGGPTQRYVAHGVCAAAGLLGIAVLLLRYRRLRARLAENRGLICLRCGYDMHGLEEMRACPECGRPFNREVDAAYWHRYVDF